MTLLAPNEPPDPASPQGPPETRAPTVEQQGRWDAALRERPDRYGPEASAPARASLELLRRVDARDLLELGGGQGRDTLFFARAGLRVTAVDFAPVAVATIMEKAEAAGLAKLVSAVECDVREPLPLADATFDACYSHMLFCMALAESQLHALAAEVRRVLRPGGLCVYTARTTSDPDFGRGTPLGGKLYELDGFAIHFFDRDLVAGIAKGSGSGAFEVLAVEELEEGELPRRLFRVTMRKPQPSRPEPLPRWYFGCRGSTAADRKRES